jgi:hypothetical protein
VSRKRSLLSKFDLEFNSFEIRRNSKKPYFKNVHDLNFEFNFKIILIQKSQIYIFRKGLNLF